MGGTTYAGCLGILFNTAHNPLETSSLGGMAGNKLALSVSSLLLMACLVLNPCMLGQRVTLLLILFPLASPPGKHKLTSQDNCALETCNVLKRELLQRRFIVLMLIVPTELLKQTANKLNTCTESMVGSQHA